MDPQQVPADARRHAHSAGPVSELVGDALAGAPVRVGDVRPARTFVAFSWDTFALTLLIQLVWVAGTWSLVMLVFARATRRLVAHGG